MNKIRSGQLFTVLLTCAAFTFLCQSAAFTMEGVFGEGIAAIAQILLCIPIVFLYRGGFSFSAYARRHQLLPLIFIGYLLIRGGVSFVRLQQSSSALSLPISGSRADRIGLSVYSIAGNSCVGEKQHSDFRHFDVCPDHHVYWCNSAGRTSESFHDAGGFHLAGISPGHVSCRRTDIVFSVAGFL